MKKLFTILFVLLLTMVTVFAQSPQKMSYQAVVRNANNSLVANQNVSVRVSLLQGSVTGAAVYVETHTVTTNANGLMTLEIGEGTVVSGNFAQINWGNGPFFLQSEIDPEGGINYSIQSVQQLMSVPYALYAERAGNVPVFSVTPTANGYTLTMTDNAGNVQTYTINNGQDGATGPQGPAGAQGPAGPQGPQGIQGETGATGPQGPQGIQGEQGPAGQSALEVLQSLYPNLSTAQLMDSLRGPQGPQGPVGAQGPAGPQGPQGIQGETGTVGPQGPQGIQGEQGPAGQSALEVLQSLYPNLSTAQLMDSLRGPQGPQGPVGAQGEAGAQGPQGPQGIQGETGATGPQGAQGEQGPAGQSALEVLQSLYPNLSTAQLMDSLRGPQGPQGPVGAQGEAGAQGPQGPQGIQGETGPAGPQGPQGVQGEQGPAGQSALEVLQTLYPNLSTAQLMDSLRGPQGPQGLQGETGPQGPQGEQGPAGQDGTMTFADLTLAQRESLRGPQGEQGPAGPQGPQGIQGETGATGPQGPQGIQGEQGPAGQSALEVLQTLYPNMSTAQLLDSLRGPQGPQGPAGAQGETGATGPQGPQGVQGETGATGPQGPQGIQGETGATGPQGPQGVQGETGATGPQGPQGVQGETGATGPQGPQGIQGIQGEQGPAGQSALEVLQTLYPNLSTAQLMDSLRGPQGPQGPQGAQGETGATGPQGPTGAQGETGATGAQGPQGIQGETGATGPQGPQGLRGETGPQGPQGETGPQGIQGPVGPAGVDGVSPIITVAPISNGSVIYIVNPNGHVDTVIVSNGQDADPDSVHVVLPPIVSTLDYALQGDSVRMYYSVLYNGNDPQVAFGIRMGLDSTNLDIVLTSETMPNVTTGAAYNGYASYVGLNSDVTYYYQAFGTNAAGSNYGNIHSFRTVPNQAQLGRPCPNVPTVTDIEGNQYATVQIGNQCWMKENLRTKHYATGSALEEGFSALFYCCQEENGKVFYTSDAAINNSSDNRQACQGVCPAGWHLPTEAEFNTLFDALGGLEAAKAKICRNGWVAEATNESGFSLDYAPTTYYSPAFQMLTTYNQVELKTSSLYHTVVVDNSGISQVGGTLGYGVVRCVKGEGTTGLPVVILDTAWVRNSTMGEARIYIIADGSSTITESGLYISTDPNPTTVGAPSSLTGIGASSISFADLQPNTTYYIKGFATNANGTAVTEVMSITTPSMMNQACPEAATVTDVDGNVYATVKIGSTCWMKEDLRVTRYSSGLEIADVSTFPSTMVLATDGATYYRNPSTGIVLYNYETARGCNGFHFSDYIQGLCPAGWRLPTTTELSDLINDLGGAESALSALKSTTGWATPGTNASGFGAYPSGVYFRSVGIIPTEYLLCSNEAAYKLMVTNDLVQMVGGGPDYGSVRCVKGDGAAEDPSLYVTISNVTATSANVEVQLLYDGNSNIQNIGFKVLEDEDLEDMTAYSVLQNRYSFTLNNLQPNTTYNVIPFTSNAGSTEDGNIYPFTTLSVTMGQPCPDAPYVSDMEGNWYSTVQIGNQCWMKENLRSTMLPNGHALILADANQSVDQDTKFYKLPDNENYRANIYGYFYNMKAVMNDAPYNYDASVQGLCPTGWHLPTLAEWTELIASIDGTGEEKAKAFSENSQFWTEGSRTNSTGFSARPSGYLYVNQSTTTSFGARTEMASASTSSDGDNYYFYISNDNVSISYQSDDAMYNVRCIKGEGATTFPPTVRTLGYTTNSYNSATVNATITYDGGGVSECGVVYSTSNQTPTLSDTHIAATMLSSNIGDFSVQLTQLDPANTYYVRAYASNSLGTNYGDVKKIVIMNVPCETATVTDANGNTYNTVQIGAQCWMKSNLRTTRYPDGTEIQSCYNNNIYFYKNPSATANVSSQYGYYYSWEAAMNGAPGNYGQPVQGICPAGWHIPTKEEFETLLTFANNDVNNLKAVSDLWSSGSSNTDSTGFSLMPSGYSGFTCSQSGVSMGTGAELMTATLNTAGGTFYYLNAAGRLAQNGKRTYVDAVRCIKGEGANNFPPVVSTLSSTVNSDNEVTVTGEVLTPGAGVEERGIVISYTETVPTYDNATHVAANCTTAVFNVTTNYYAGYVNYVRAYAKNAQGVSYGEVDTIVAFNIPCRQTSLTVDGVTYGTTQIGGQCWMTENLRTTTGYEYVHSYVADDGTTQYYATSYAYCYWNHSENLIARGVYYDNELVKANNSFSITHPNTMMKGVCPQGWHIPTKTETDALIQLLGGNTSGSKLKSTTEWSTVGTNESGLNMKPTGYVKGANFSTSSSPFLYGTTNSYFWITGCSVPTAFGVGNSSNNITYYSRATNDYCNARCVQNPINFSNVSTSTQSSHPGYSYGYNYSCSVNMDNYARWFGQSNVVECGVVSEDGQYYPSTTTNITSSTFTIQSSVQFTTNNSFYYVYPYVKLANGEYYYGGYTSMNANVVF